jgi:hypothetical protein
MNKILVISLVLILMPVIAFGQLYPENIFGLDVPITRWDKTTDQQFFSSSFEERLFHPLDIASIRFDNGDSLSEVLLIVESAGAKVRWLRVRESGGVRTIVGQGHFGHFGLDIGEFRAPYSIAVAGGSEYYNPATDHIFVGDRTNNRLVKLNYDYNPGAPGSDRLVWESSVFIDTNCFFFDLEYVDYATGNLNDNRLFAVDDIGNRLCVFGHNGDLVNIFNLREVVADTVIRIYQGITSRLLPNGSVMLYIADFGNTNVCAFQYSNSGELSFVNEINLGDMHTTAASIVRYDDRFGLWAIEGDGPRIYKLTLNLSHIIMEINGENFNLPLINGLFNICILPDRMVLFEEMTDHSGLLSLAFNPPSGKRELEEPAAIPYVFRLSQNYPNPFNSKTLINYEIPAAGFVTIKIYNILGQEVKTLLDSYQIAGPHSVIWDGTNRSDKEIASGIYFSKLSSGENIEIKKMLLLK